MGRRGRGPHRHRAGHPPRRREDAGPSVGSPGASRPGPAGRATGPRIWNLPYAPSRNFTGREGQLAAIRDAFRRGERAALTALHGLGGVGKTQIALEYDHRHRDEYDVVWWLRAEEPPVLAADFAELAYELNLAPREPERLSGLLDAVGMHGYVVADFAGAQAAFERARDL